MMSDAVTSIAEIQHVTMSTFSEVTLHHFMVPSKTQDYKTPCFQFVILLGLFKLNTASACIMSFFVILQTRPIVNIVLFAITFANFKSLRHTVLPGL